MVFVGAAPDGYGGVDRLPFERGGLPGIIAGGSAAAGAPDEIEEEQKLCRAEDESSPGNAAFHGEQRGERRGAAGDVGRSVAAGRPDPPGAWERKCRRRR